MELSEKIKKIRLDNNLSQKDFANKIGISTSSIQKYEYGNVKPSSEILFKILKVFNISEKDFFNNSSLSDDEISIIKMDMELLEVISDEHIENKKNIDIILEYINFDISDYQKYLLYSIACNGDFKIKFNSEKKNIEIYFYKKNINSKNIYSCFELKLSDFRNFLLLIEESFTKNLMEIMYFNSEKAIFKE